MQSRNDAPPDLSFLRAGGAMGRAIAAQDWSRHPLGPVPSWPAPLRIVLGTVLASGFPSYVAWGDELHTLYNDAYAGVLGSRASLGQGLPLAELWAEVAGPVRTIALRALAGAPTYVEDMPFMLNRHGTPAQAYFTFSCMPVHDGEGAIGGMVATVIETTAKIAAMAALRDSDERFRLSLEASGNIGTWSVDPDTNITYMDERFARIFGIDAGIARSGAALVDFTQRIHPDDRPVVEAAVERAIAGHERYDIDYRIVQPGGAITWVTAKGKMFTDAATARQRFAGVAVDITDRKGVEHALREAGQRKDEFLAMLAHELRNPLAPISAAAQLLQTGRLDEERVRKTSAIIVRQVEHMTSLVNDLLDVSRVTRGLVTLDRTQVDIATIVAEAIEQVAPQVHARRHRLRLDLAPGPATVFVDRKRLVQVIVNIVHNAAKYTAPGGNIAVRTAVHGGEVVLDVTDDGVGMAPELAGRVFDLFAQAHVTPDRNSGGLGLGLSLVKSLVELHGGTVSCSSPGPGLGSCFAVQLPAMGGGAAVAPPSAMPVERVPQAPLRLMVVDDNRDAAGTLAMLLRLQGHDVVVEHSSQAALRRAAATPFHACLLDIGLPHMDGTELARLLRRLPGMGGAVLLAVTGYGQEEDRQRTRAAGFDHHFVKPVDMGQLAAALAGIAGGGAPVQAQGPAPMDS